MLLVRTRVLWCNIILVHVTVIFKYCNFIDKLDDLRDVIQILLICIKIYPETYCSFSPPNKMLTI